MLNKIIHDIDIHVGKNSKNGIMVTSEFFYFFFPGVIVIQRLESTEHG